MPYYEGKGSSPQLRRLLDEENRLKAHLEDELRRWEAARQRHQAVMAEIRSRITAVQLKIAETGEMVTKSKEFGTAGMVVFEPTPAEKEAEREYPPGQDVRLPNWS